MSKVLTISVHVLSVHVPIWLILSLDVQKPLKEFTQEYYGHIMLYYIVVNVLKRLVYYYKSEFKPVESTLSQHYVCRTCQQWNTIGCDKPGKTKHHCGFGANFIRHGCAKILGANDICWSRDHRESDHK